MAGIRPARGVPGSLATKSTMTRPSSRGPLGPDASMALADPGPGLALTPQALGEHTAHLVWETFSEFLVSPELTRLVQTLEIPAAEGIPDEHGARELLIFHLWAHTQAIQQGLGSRNDLEGDPREVLRQVLDTLHRAFFEDLEETGVPRAHLPLFEQRVSARYAEYYQAAETDDLAVGKAAMLHLLNGAPEPGGAEAVLPHPTALLAQRAREVAAPFRDYLASVELRSS